MRILDEISWIADKSIHNTGAQMEKLRERSGAAGHIYEPPTTPPSPVYTPAPEYKYKCKFSGQLIAVSS